MEKFIAFFIAGLISFPVYCQVWRYNVKHDTIKGNYKTVTAQGTAAEFPYQKPLLIINVYSNNPGNPEIYFTKVPCACCKNTRVMIRFDEEEKRHNFYVTTNETEDIWVLLFKKESIRWDGKINEWIDYVTDIDDPGKLSDFINNLKIHNRMYVRLRDDCRRYTCEFSLKGSSAALNLTFSKK